MERISARLVQKARTPASLAVFGAVFLERRFLEPRDGALKDGVGIGRLWRGETALDEAADSLGAARTIVLCGGPGVQSIQGFRL
jgi:hypothetical protein